MDGLTGRARKGWGVGFLLLVASTQALAAPGVTVRLDRRTALLKVSASGVTRAEALAALESAARVKLQIAGLEGHEQEVVTLSMTGATLDAALEAILPAGAQALVVEAADDVVLGGLTSAKAGPMVAREARPSRNAPGADPKTTLGLPERPPLSEADQAAVDLHGPGLKAAAQMPVLGPGDDAPRANEMGPMFPLDASLTAERHLRLELAIGDSVEVVKAMRMPGGCAPPQTSDGDLAYVADLGGRFVAYGLLPSPRSRRAVGPDGAIESPPGRSTIPARVPVSLPLEAVADEDGRLASVTVYAIRSRVPEGLTPETIEPYRVMWTPIGGATGADIARLLAQSSGSARRTGTP